MILGRCVHYDTVCMHYACMYVCVCVLILIVIANAATTKSIQYHFQARQNFQVWASIFDFLTLLCLTMKHTISKCEIQKNIKMAKWKPKFFYIWYRLYEHWSYDDYRIYILFGHTEYSYKHFLSRSLKIIVLW